MKLLRQLAIVLSICLLGEAINSFFSLSIPGNVLGMIILLILLTTNVLKLEMIDHLAKFLLDNLAFFFIPAGVGVISTVHLLEGQWVPVMLIIIISTVAVIVTTGLTIQLLQKKER